MSFGTVTGTHVLTRLKFDCVYPYLDDFLIYSKNFDQLLDYVSQVLSRLHNAPLTVKPPNVVFAAREISFLGYCVSALRVFTDPDRTETIRNFPPTKDGKVWFI